MKKSTTIRILVFSLILFPSTLIFAAEATPTWEEVSALKGRVDEVEKHLCAHPTPAAQANCPADSKAKDGVEGVATQAQHLENATAIRRELDFYEAFKPFHFNSQKSSSDLQATLEATKKVLAQNQNLFEKNQSNALEYDDLLTKLKSKMSIQAVLSANSDIITNIKEMANEKVLQSKDDIADTESNIKNLESVLAKVKDASDKKAYRQEIDDQKKELQQEKSNVKMARAIAECLKETTRIHCGAEAKLAMQKQLESDLNDINSEVSLYKQAIESKTNLIATLQTQIAATGGAQPDSDEAKLNSIESGNSVEIQKLLDAHKTDRCGMSNGEILAIQSYTSTGYSILNSALRNSGDNLAKVQPVIDELNSALKKLAPFDGYVLRGATLPPAIQAQHQVGKIVTYDSFTSTSLTRGFPDKDLFIIHSRTGRYIGTYSGIYGEAEVLFASGTKFKVISVEQKEGRSYYTLDEVTP